MKFGGGVRALCPKEEVAIQTVVIHKDEMNRFDTEQCNYWKNDTDSRICSNACYSSPRFVLPIRDHSR